jgi:hypothetical protein
MMVYYIKLIKNILLYIKSIIAYYTIYYYLMYDWYIYIYETFLLTELNNQQNCTITQTALFTIQYILS